MKTNLFIQSLSARKTIMFSPSLFPSICETIKSNFSISQPRKLSTFSFVESFSSVQHYKSINHINAHGFDLSRHCREKCLKSSWNMCWQLSGRQQREQQEKGEKTKLFLWNLPNHVFLWYVEWVGELGLGLVMLHRRCHGRLFAFRFSFFRC